MEPILSTSGESAIPETPSPTYESCCLPLAGIMASHPQLQVPRFFPFPLMMAAAAAAAASTTASSVSVSAPAETTNGRVVMSSLLEELRLKPSDFLATRGLTEVLPEVGEFACDQFGSRFLQTSMEKADGAEIHELFLAVLPSVARLSVDPFGNYVVQKMVDILSEEHRTLLGEQLLGQVVVLSTNTYGCRVVQKILEVAVGERQRGKSTELGRTIGKQLESRVLEFIKDQNGNHVIQKAIDCLHNIDFILAEIKGKIAHLALHCYGCRVIQRLLERSSPAAETAAVVCEVSETSSLVEEVMDKLWKLSIDQFGNYVVQHVLVYGSSLQRDAIVRIVADRVVEFSCHKFASNVAERALVVASESGRALIISALLNKHAGKECAIIALTRDRYANYVVQRCVQVSTGSQKTQLVKLLKSQSSNLKKVIYGKHILATLDKHSTF